MSKNSQDGSDEYEVIFDGASTETKKYDVIDAEVSEETSLKSDGFELSDEDIEEGIFAPERREKQKSKKSSSLMVAVSVLALAGVGAFVYVSNPEMIKKVTQNFSDGTGVTVPDEVIAVDNTASIVDPMNLTAQQPAPDQVAATADAPVVTPTEGEQIVLAADATATVPPNDVTPDVSAATPVETPVEAAAEAPKEPIKDAPADAVVTPAMPSVDIQSVTADSETVMPTADPLVDTATSLADAPVADVAAQPAVAAVAPEVAPSVVAPAPEAVKAPVVEAKQDAQKVEEKKPEAEPVKSVKADEKKKEPAAVKPDDVKKAEDKPVIVASKEEKKVLDDANLDKYFDSPGGKMLKDIPAPSMDPKKGSRESIIIVNKKGQKNSETSSSRSGSGAVSIEMTSLSAQTISANRAMKLGRYDAAKEMFDELYRLNPKDGQILSGRALLLQKMGFADQAIAAYEELLQIYPDNTDAIVNLAGLIRKQYPAVALNKLLDLHMAHPSNVFVTAQLGVAYADAGNFNDALRYLEMAAAMDSQNAQHFYNLAVISEKASKPDQAVKYYEKALDVDTIYGEGHRKISREKIYDRLAKIRGN